MKKFLAGLLVLGLLFFGGCQKTIMDSPDEQSGFFFDTPVTIKIYDRGKKRYSMKHLKNWQNYMTNGISLIQLLN
ncbi:MAG: hypothetical protein RSC16_10320 [Enterococcus sp.]|uniref:hypothetical protein n=1 Tax=Enterococcus sp. TaxID=35783 RepID=UPI002FCA4FC5